MNKPASNSFSMPVWVLVFGFILFGPLMAMGPRFTPGIIVYGTMALLPLLVSHWRSLKDFYFKPVVALAAVALIYSCASAAWSPSLRATDMAIDIFYLAVTGALVAGEFYFTPQKTKPAFVLFFAASLIAGFAILVVEFAFDHPIHRWFNNVPPGSLLSSSIDKRLISLFSLGIWPLAAWLDQSKLKRWAVASIGLFLCIALYSSSRAAALGLVFGIVAMLTASFWPRITRWVLMGLIVCGLVLIVPGFYLAGKMPQQDLQGLFSSAQHRVEIWKLTVPHVLQAPVFGHGIDASRGIVTEVPEGTAYMNAGQTIISQHPHNIFLQLWLDFGAVGVLLWGALMLMLIHAIRLMPRNVQPYALGAGFCSFILLSTSYSPLQAWWLAMHITTVLILALVAQCTDAGIQETNERFLRAALKRLRLSKPQ